MTTPAKKEQIHEYAGGWITERGGTEVPGFLKLACVVIAGGALAYFLVYMWGETGHADRGPLVRALNASTEGSSVLMFAVATLIVVFGVIVSVFAFRKSRED